MKDILTSPRMEDLRRKRRNRRRRLSVLVVVLVVAIVGGCSYFSASPRLLINTVTVSGTRIINAPDVEDAVRQDLAGKYIKLFARGNAFLYPKSKIYNHLIAAFPRIQTLSVYRDNIHTIHIDIVERSGSSLYCGSQVPEAVTDIGENCYFVNDDGYIFDHAPYFSGNIYFKYYTSLDTTDAGPLGTQMLEPERFHEMVRFIDGLTALGFKPDYLVMDQDGNDTLYLDHSAVATSPTILFKDSNELPVILDNLTTSMGKPEFANEIHSKYASLLYIDLRFKDKVLYKFQ